MRQKFRNIRIYPLDKSLSRNWFIKYQVPDYKTGKWVWKQYSGYINLYSTLEERSKEAMRCYNMLLRGEEPVKVPGARLLPSVKELPNFANTVQLLSEYLREKQSIAGITVQNYKSKIKVLHKWLQETGNSSMPVGQFSSQYAIRFIGWLKQVKGYRNTTCNKYKSILGSLWADMILNGIVDVNPWHQFKGMTKDSLPFRTYPETMQQLVNSTLPKFNEQLYMAAMVIYYDFIRPAELTRLRLYNIEWDRQCFRLTADISKTKNDRSIVIPDALFSMLLAKGYDKLPATHYLFTADGRPGTNRIGKNWFNRKFLEYRRRYKIPDEYKIYGFKHTGNSRLGISGINPQIQQKHNRHRDMKSIEPYNSGISSEDMYFMRTQFPKFGERVEALSRDKPMHGMENKLDKLFELVQKVYSETGNNKM